MVKKKPQKKFSSSGENPFNIKVNRNKHSVLGQKMKGTRGKPGVSHSMGNAKRKEIFHKRKVQSRKANKFLDKRLLDSSQTYEDPATARLIQERKKKFKKSIFNLNEEESLTHKGIPLLSNDNYNDDIADSEDEEPLDAQFVKEAHFGGFSQSTTSKSRKEIIDDLIVESKKRKHEKKLAREHNADLIEKLDQEWKERHTSLPLLKADKHKDVPDKNDPFDIILQELKFEKRSTPTSRLKTPEEIAKEEHEKLKKLEEERSRRMMNPMDKKEDINNQLSADSIYDGLDIQFETLDEKDGGNVNGTAIENVSDESGDDSSDDSEDETNFNNSIMNKRNSVSVMSDDVSKIPDSLDKFCNVINDQEEELYVVIENILKSVIKNKTKQNLEKLETFFAILIEYVMNSSDSSNTALEALDTILPHLYTLAEISPVNTADKLLDLLDEEQKIFQQNKGKKMKKNFPRFQCLILFKISSVIYSVSDFKHPVVTPVIIFMCDILSSAYAVSFQNVFSRLFICKIMYDCVSYSKRYVSEVMWLLNKSLELAINNNKKFNIVIDEDVPVQEKSELCLELPDILFNNVTKVSLIFEIIELLNRYALLYQDLLSYHEIFSTTLNICSKLPLENYPNFLKEAISDFVTAVKSVKKTYKPLVYENKKPVPLKLFEPAFDSKFTRKKDDIKKKRKLIKSVSQKIRKEERGLLREMRRDNQVIASEKLKERLEADDERKRKVKLLYSELAMQEGEFKKFVKKK